MSKKKNQASKRQKKQQKGQKQIDSKLLIAGIAVLAAIVTLVVVLLSPNPFAPETDFTVYTADGEKVRLSDFAGKPIVLNFWASWCAPCLAEMPDIQKAYEKYGDEVHFVIVNLTYSGNESQEKAQDLLAKKAYTFPVYYDIDADAGNAYGIESIPTTFFFDKNGKLQESYDEMMDEAMMMAGIEKILK